MIVELAPGDVFMFPDSLLHHANEEVTGGQRNSIVAFTQEKMFHYWKRKYGYVNNKDKRKRKSGSKKGRDRLKWKGKGA